MNDSPSETRSSLILRLQDAADIAAWDEFAEIYAPAIFRSARRLGLQAADADDVVQEVLSAVARSVADWLDRDDRGAFRAWLFRIARNLSIDFLTRRKHRPCGIGGEEAAKQLADLKVNQYISSDFDEELQREMFNRASGIVRSLVSNSTWQSFHRTAVLGESIDKVATDLGISKGSVYISRSRVMKRLQVAVSSFGKRIDDEVR